MKKMRWFTGGDDSGITILEVMAAMIILMVVVPAVFISYSALVATSEQSLATLQCISTARHYGENLKALRYDGLRDLLNNPASQGWTNEGSQTISKVDANWAGSGIDIRTTIKATTVQNEVDGVETVAEAILVTIQASRGKVTIPLAFLVAEGGY